MDEDSPRAVVLDTNLFVAAGFNPRSRSARILDAVRQGRLRLVWNEQTRRETERIIRQIPPLSWEPFADLFREEDRYDGETHPERFRHVADPDDRKFAALAEATGAVLITSDDHLLETRDQAAVVIMRPEEFLR